MVNLVISLFGIFIILYAIISQYKVVQSCHYEIGKYFKYKLYKKIFVQAIGLIFVTIYFISSKLDKIIVLIFFLILLNFLLIEKGNLKLTNRVKRFIAIYLIVSCFYFCMPFNKIDLLMIVGLFLYFWLLVIHSVSCLLENLIMKFYIKDAQKIIRGVNVIGITGSYGKTSCKNIIGDMLNLEFNISKTPKSFNNKVGIVKSIRECVNESDDYFICEYGVDKKGGMDKLLKIVKPNISLITEVGPQHLLTFKNIENIKNEKLKIAKILNDNEIAVINNDNIYLHEGLKELKCKVITYGIKSESDIMAKNIIMNSKGSNFDLYIDNKKYKNLKICLLGEHNILNVLGAIGVAKSIGVNLNKLNTMVPFIRPIEHRLENKILDGVKVIDDSFNSNQIGFKKAIDVLNLMKEEKYVITPGIIEQGKNSKIINYELGRYMADKIDFAILVEENATIIKEGLLSNGFKESQIIIHKDFKEAWSYVKQINNNNKIFLIENDLPSIYLK